MEAKTKKGLVVAALILGVGYFFYKKLKSRNTTTIVDLPKNKETSGYNPTLSQDKMKELADKMFIAFNGYGTDISGKNGLMNLFSSIKNNDDLMGVIAAYGIRQVDSGAFNPFPDFKGNLPETLANELSDSDLTKVNNVLLKNSISISFNPDGMLTTF